MSRTSAIQFRPSTYPSFPPSSVIPVKAGIQGMPKEYQLHGRYQLRIPVFAGMTDMPVSRHFNAVSALAYPLPFSSASLSRSSCTGTG